MQTIDAIRRTNELSKVLKQHGFAEDSFQAVDAATDALGTDHDMPETEYSTVVSGDRMGEKTLQKIANLERSKHLLASRLDALQQEHAKSQEQFKHILSRLDGAEAKLRALRTQPAMAAVSSVAPEQPQLREPEPIPAPQQSSQPQSTTPARESHPRQAQGVDEAVSIENIFYCGTR